MRVSGDRPPTARFTVALRRWTHPPEETSSTAPRKRPVRTKVGHDGRIIDLHAVVANEPRSYREAIYGTLKQLRPGFTITLVGPEDLDREVLRSRPNLVVCSRVTPVVEQSSCSLIELYPDDFSCMIITVAGERTVFADPKFETLLSAIDEIGLLHV